MAGLVTRKSIGLKRAALVESTGRSNVGSRPKRRYPYFAICVQNHGHEPSLQIGKVYRIIKAEKGDRATDVRVVDEEGEDYLYDAKWFVAVDVPRAARQAIVGRA